MLNFTLLGIRNLQHAQIFTSTTLRSTTSTKSDDRPPPYDDELPPPYHEAIKMTPQEKGEKEGNGVDICQPSTSDAQQDIMTPSTSSMPDSVQIVISREHSPIPSETNYELSEDEGISRNISSAGTGDGDVVVPGDGDETDSRNRTQKLKYVSVGVVV